MADGYLASCSRRLPSSTYSTSQAVARAAQNKYLADSLERLFGLSQRLWFLALPRLETLPSAVEKHLELVEAIADGDSDRAEEIMRQHVADFYGQVREILQTMD